MCRLWTNIRKMRIKFVCFVWKCNGPMQKDPWLYGVENLVASQCFTRSLWNKKLANTYISCLTSFVQDCFIQFNHIHHISGPGEYIVCLLIWLWLTSDVAKLTLLSATVCQRCLSKKVNIFDCVVSTVDPDSEFSGYSRRDLSTAWPHHSNFFLSTFIISIISAVLAKSSAVFWFG